LRSGRTLRTRLAARPWRASNRDGAVPDGGLSGLGAASQRHDAVRGNIGQAKGEAALHVALRREAPIELDRNVLLVDAAEDAQLARGDTGLKDPDSGGRRAGWTSGGGRRAQGRRRRLGEDGHGADRRRDRDEQS